MSVDADEQMRKYDDTIFAVIYDGDPDLHCSATSVRILSESLRQCLQLLFADHPHMVLTQTTAVHLSFLFR